MRSSMGSAVVDLIMMASHATECCDQFMAIQERSVSSSRTHIAHAVGNTQSGFNLGLRAPFRFRTGR
ncbi:MAG: hypothetical protein ACI8TQ_003340 [Planctomycetota bacterium]|jgi:hypothetical protein